MRSLLRTKWSSGSTENKAELDKTIATDFNATSIDTVKSSIAQMQLAFIKRDAVCKAPLAVTDQVEKVMEKLDKIGAIKKFVGDFNQKYKVCDRTVEKIVAELAEYLHNDRDRITTALRDEAGAYSHRAYAALQKDGTASASQSAIQSAGRSASSSPGRRERTAGSSSPGQDSSREIKETLRKLRKQLMDKANEKKAEFCPVCLVENHSLGRCYVAEKARKEAADADSKKDGTGRGAGDQGGRGRGRGKY